MFMKSGGGVGGGGQVERPARLTSVYQCPWAQAVYLPTGREREDKPREEVCEAL